MHITVITLSGYNSSGKETIGKKAEGSSSIDGCCFLHRLRFHKGFAYEGMGCFYP